MKVNPYWMRAQYIRLNEELFGGQLPTNIDFKTDMCSTRWGCASAQIYRGQNRVVPTYISMSNYIDAPENVRIGVLVHEMVHVADYVFHPEHYLRRKPRYDCHGPEFFLKEAQRLSQYGFHIQKFVSTEDQEQATLSDEAKARIERTKDRLKKQGIDGVRVLILHGADGRKDMIAKPPISFDCTEQSILNYWGPGGWWKSIDVCTTTDPKWVQARGNLRRGYYTDQYGDVYTKFNLRKRYTIYFGPAEPEEEEPEMPQEQTSEVVCMVLLKGQPPLIFKIDSSEIDNTTEHIKSARPNGSEVRYYKCDDSIMSQLTSDFEPSPSPQFTTQVLKGELIKRDKIMEGRKSLKQIIREQLENYVAGDKLNIVGGNPQVKQLNDEVEEITIE